MSGHRVIDAGTEDLDFTPATNEGPPE